MTVGNSLTMSEYKAGPLLDQVALPDDLRSKIKDLSSIGITKIKI